MGDDLLESGDVDLDLDLEIEREGDFEMDLDLDLDTERDGERLESGLLGLLTRESIDKRESSIKERRESSNLESLILESSIIELLILESSNLESKDWENLSGLFLDEGRLVL